MAGGDYQEVEENGLVPLRNNFLRPTAKIDDQKFEFYFLIDVSSSMEGAPWELASRALLLFLQSLPEDCYFNVIAFDHRFTSIFPSSVKYSQETLEKARDAIPGLFTCGATDLLGPLQYVYGCQQKSGYLTQIFSLTDGYTNNREQVLSLVDSKMKHSRSFSLGIGDEVDRELVKGMAENAGGMYEFVTYNEMIESKVLHQLKVALKPALLKPIRDVKASRLIAM